MKTVEKLSKAAAMELITDAQNGNYGGLAWALDTMDLTHGAVGVLAERLDLVVKAQASDADAYSMERERRFAARHCAFAIKLKSLARGNDLRSRIACAKHIFSSCGSEGGPHFEDVTGGYVAFSLFRFGPRQFDSLFEMGDGDEVRAALERLALRDPVVAQNCERMGWSEQRDQDRFRG